MSVVRPAHDHDFADVVLGSAVPVVVGFHAGGQSEAHERLLEVLDEVAAAGDGLGVASVDVVQAPRTAAAYGVNLVPSVVVFSAGTMLLALPGTPSRDTVLHMLRVVLPASASAPALPPI